MLDQLKRRGRALANRCFLCEEEETIDYLLLHCPSVEMFWELLLAIVGQVGSSHSRFEKLSWQGTLVGKKRKKVWLVASLCLLWTTWCERNMVAFYNEVFSANKVWLVGIFYFLNFN